MSPTCYRCGRTPEQIGEYRAMAEGTGLSATAWMVAEEGTYNPSTDHFACTRCYIQAGQPVRDDGKRWVAP